MSARVQAAEAHRGEDVLFPALMEHHDQQQQEQEQQQPEEEKEKEPRLQFHVEEREAASASDAGASGRATEIGLAVRGVPPSGECLRACQHTCVPV